MATTLGGVVLPRVHVQEATYDWVGKPIRRWVLQTRPVTYAQQQAIVEMIAANGGIAQVERAVDGTSHSIGGGAVLMALDEGGGAETIAQVYITAFRVVRPVTLPRRRALEIEVEEA